MKCHFQHVLGFRHVPNPLKQTEQAGQPVPEYAVVCLEGLLAPIALALGGTWPSHPGRDFPGAHTSGGRQNIDVVGQEQCLFSKEPPLSGPRFGWFSILWAWWHHDTVGGFFLATACCKSLLFTKIFHKQGAISQNKVVV